MLLAQVPIFIVTETLNTLILKIIGKHDENYDWFLTAGTQTLCIGKCENIKQIMSTINVIGEINGAGTMLHTLPESL